ncbi:MAG TPA: ATP-binding protein [Polyangiaceae bacterium]|nr:ATP-binding protein [Polyangiaceae bacterium]
MTTTLDDWRSETQARLPNSKIYQALSDRSKNDPGALPALELVNEATFYAYQKTKTILRHMGEFTLHDGDHLFRVLMLMERLLSQEQIQELTTPELTLLILSAFFHDIGMAAEERDVLSWRKTWDIAPAFVDDRDRNEHDGFKRYCAARPDQTSRIETFLLQGLQSATDTAKNYLIADYIRATHAERARSIIKADWLGKIRYRDTDLTVEFASVCFSHNEDAVVVLDLDRKMLCGPEVYACLPLVAAILRLADILDFDAKRTPTVLFSHLFVRHPVSLREWNKHRAIEAWAISPSTIQFHAKCSHPAIEHSIHSFCDLIDRELSTCNNIFSSLNEFHRNSGRHLNITLPLRVDRTKIETRKTIDGKPEYLFRETQFSLSKSQVIDLLMGTKLYGNPEVALRELLQNSIDACLLRQSLEGSWKNAYTPEISVRYFKDGGEDVLEVVDNGIGMDQRVIDSYYTKIGSSFYKSSDFYDLKSQTNSKFTPTSRFGIGILSCFMVADTLIVDTRKVYEPHRSSDPLNLTIEGQDSIFWIRPGTRETPGTTTRLRLRNNKNPWLRMNEDQFITSVENVIPNPPFRISVQTTSHNKVRDSKSFKKIKASSLKDYSWEAHDNIREFQVDFTDARRGFVGSAIVGVLELKGLPVDRIEMTSKSVQIDDDEYELKKSLAMKERDIELITTSITIDDDNKIRQSSSKSSLVRSRSKLSLHGIEVPTTLFPEAWNSQPNQVSLTRPLPLLIVVDVCGERDLDLNSSRTQILMSDQWMTFEDLLTVALAQGIANQVSASYWDALKNVMMAGSTSETLRKRLSAISPRPKATARMSAK